MGVGVALPCDSGTGSYVEAVPYYKLSICLVIGQREMPSVLRKEEVTWRVSNDFIEMYVYEV